MSVVVASCNLAQLLSGEVITPTEGELITGSLAIPEYQRPYCWGESQLDKLWKDYLNYKKNHQKNAWYLGSIILHKDPSGILNIIDGQQRLTSLALIDAILSPHQISKYVNNVSYNSPQSHHQIRSNLRWLLKVLRETSEPTFSPTDVNFTLVVTDSEDEAYRFFETQNTGGVRLTGPDIIKAHHLRSIEHQQQNYYARRWESLGDLNLLISFLLRGRYCNTLRKRDVPSHRKPLLVRNAVVTEFGEMTTTGPDIAYGRSVSHRTNNSSQGHYLVEQAPEGYELRQPLNAGINAIHYLIYFHRIHNHFMSPDMEPEFAITPEHKNFLQCYQELIIPLEGCLYLKELLDTALMLYISQFGERNLTTALKKLFMVIYSPRVTNEKTVKESTLNTLLDKAPVLDWITSSYTTEMCFQWLNNYNFNIDTNNIGPNDNSVKKRFIYQVLRYFDIKVSHDISAQSLAYEYQNALQIKIINLSHQD
ncbi:DUF262 domain-containing protein [Enterobacter hormaechei subsp. steigerwaltii]